MNFAIHEDNYTKIAAESELFIAEVITPYTGQLAALRTIERYKGKLRVVFAMDIDFLSSKEVDKLAKMLNELLEVNSNIAFMLPIPTTTLARKVQNIFLDRNYAARTPQEAMSLFNVGIKEIYVTGSLAANLNAVRELRKFMKIRLIPNEVQTDAFEFGNPALTNPFTCFWMRPEALSLYEGAVSTIEFSTDDKHIEEGLVDIYASGKWGGKLGDIIIDRTGTLSEFDSYYLPVIDKEKAYCGLRCQSIGLCHSCQQIPYQAKFLRETK